MSAVGKAERSSPAEGARRAYRFRNIGNITADLPDKGQSGLVAEARQAARGFGMVGCFDILAARMEAEGWPSDPEDSAAALRAAP